MSPLCTTRLPFHLSLLLLSLYKRRWCLAGDLLRLFAYNVSEQCARTPGLQHDRQDLRSRRSSLDRFHDTLSTRLLGSRETFTRERNLITDRVKMTGVFCGSIHDLRLIYNIYRLTAILSFFFFFIMRRSCCHVSLLRDRLESIEFSLRVETSKKHFCQYLITIQ